MIKNIFFLFLLLISVSFGAEKLDINADVFEIDAKTNQVIASGNVIVRQKDVTIRGVYCLYNQKSQKVFMSRGVQVRKNKMVMTCDRLEADGEIGRAHV